MIWSITSQNSNRNCAEVRVVHPWKYENGGKYTKNEWSKKVHFPIISSHKTFLIRFQYSKCAYDAKFQLTAPNHVGFLFLEKWGKTGGTIFFIDFNRLSFCMSSFKKEANKVGMNSIYNMTSICVFWVLNNFWEFLQAEIFVKQCQTLFDSWFSMYFSWFSYFEG